MKTKLMKSKTLIGCLFFLVLSGCSEDAINQAIASGTSPETGSSNSISRIVSCNQSSNLATDVSTSILTARDVKILFYSNGDFQIYFVEIVYSGNLFSSGSYTGWYPAGSNELSLGSVLLQGFGIVVRYNLTSKNITAENIGDQNLIRTLDCGTTYVRK